MTAIVSPAEKVKQFPPSPGVYLMKDAQGVVLYIGKAKNLRNRAGHYFTKAGAEDSYRRPCETHRRRRFCARRKRSGLRSFSKRRSVEDVRPRFNVELHRLPGPAARRPLQDARAEGNCPSSTRSTAPPWP